MKLNSKGSIARFYMWSYRKRSEFDLPDNFCLFFWALLWAIILFIPSIPGYLALCVIELLDTPAVYKEYRFRMSDKIGSTFIIVVLSMLVGGLGALTYNAPWVMLSIVLILSGAVLVIGLFCYLGDNGIFGEVIDIIDEKATSFKKGYCPRISWYKKDETN